MLGRRAPAPDAWRFVFFDPGTSGNCRVVTVAAKTSSEHLDTVEAFSAARNENGATSHVIAQNKLGVDSDHAPSCVRTSSKLKGVRAAEYKLSQVPKGSPEALWNLTFFADGPQPVARFQVGAKSGTVKILANE